MLIKGTWEITCNILQCATVCTSALQRRDALKEIGRFYTRQEKTPKMFSISGGGASTPSAPPAHAPGGGTKCKGWENFAILNEITVYLGNGTR